MLQRFGREPRLAPLDSAADLDELRGAAAGSELDEDEREDRAEEYRSSSKVGVADRATPRPEPGAAAPLGAPGAVPRWGGRGGRAGREGAAPLDTAPCGVHPSVSCWKSEDGNGAAREDSDIDSGVDGGKGEEGVFESGSGE